MNERVVEITSINGVELLVGIESVRNEILELREKIKPLDDTVLLTPNEVCDWLSISKPTLNDWSKKGVLKRYKVGNRAYYKKIEILHVLDDSTSKD